MLINLFIIYLFIMFSDRNVQVMYVGEDILQYHAGLLKWEDAKDGAGNDTSSPVRRFVVLTPEAVDKFLVISN